MSKNKKITNADFIDGIKPIFQEIISESGWIAGPTNKGAILFTTPLLNKYLPKNGSKNWLNHESFTFSIFYDKNIYLISKILPGNSNTRKILSGALSNIKSLKQPKTNQVWVNHILLNTNLSISDFANKNKSQIKTILKNNLHKITAEVNKVEAAILMHKKELKNLLPHPDTYYILHRAQKLKLRIIKTKPAIRELTTAA